MTNKDIALSIKMLADLMELHEENAFRIKSYANAYLAIRKFPGNLTESTESDISSFPGLGKSVAQKIVELVSTGNIGDLELLKAKTPPGVVDMLSVKGLGPKKVKVLWKGELGIEDTAELFQACQENRLIKLPGFGVKTQEDIKEKLQFHFSSLGKFHLASLYDLSNELVSLLREKQPKHLFEINGELRRKLPVVKGIEILSTCEPQQWIEEILPMDEVKNGFFYKDIPVFYKVVEAERYPFTWLTDSCSPEFTDAAGWKQDSYDSEEAVFESVGLPYVVPEFRELASTVSALREGKKYQLIEDSDIKGLIHNHSTYSDGAFSLEEMLKAARQKGYQYMVISDHSASAFYANGLKEETVLAQWKEIDELNRKHADFKVIKGIESDILNDGSLDYPDEILAGFEIVIASIHSNLRMEKQKATQRLIKAIENRFTHILGHPTGRLLLGRKGYEIDHHHVIDACAANGVAIELNCNPLRMDLDWTFIPYALNKGVKICISPDAHSTAHYDFVKYGIFTARKAGLSPTECLNNLDANQLLEWSKIKQNINS